jgi:hypothetical protein
MDRREEIWRNRVQVYRGICRKISLYGLLANRKKPKVLIIPS